MDGVDYYHHLLLRPQYHIGFAFTILRNWIKKEIRNVNTKQSYHGSNLNFEKLKDLVSYTSKPL